MLTTPSSGVVCLTPRPAPLTCPECGKPTPNCGIWNQPDYRCRNPLCARFPFKPAERVEH